MGVLDNGYLGCWLLVPLVPWDMDLWSIGEAFGLHSLPSMMVIASWNRFWSLFSQVRFFIVLGVGFGNPLFAIWGPKWPPRAPKIDVLGAKILPKSIPEPKNRIYAILWKSYYSLGASMISRVRPFQKSIKIDPAPLQMVVRGSKSAWERLFPAFLRFHCPLGIPPT